MIKTAARVLADLKVREARIVKAFLQVGSALCEVRGMMAAEGVDAVVFVRRESSRDDRRAESQKNERRE